MIVYQQVTRANKLPIFKRGAWSMCFRNNAVALMPKSFFNELDRLLSGLLVGLLYNVTSLSTIDSIANDYDVL